MTTQVDRISEQIAKLDREAQRELVQRLPILLSLSREDLDWLRAAETEYARREQRIAGARFRRLSRMKQRRLDELADKGNAGLLTGGEYEEYSQLVDEAQRLTIENARRLAQWLESEPGDERSGSNKWPRRRAKTAKRTKG
jgi:hypothetical protein